jgi:hypothetical protein
MTDQEYVNKNTYFTLHSYVIQNMSPIQSTRAPQSTNGGPRGAPHSLRNSVLHTV